MKKLMIETLIVIYGVVIMLVLYVFMTRALQVQTEITKVTQETVNKELDVLKLGNQSAGDIQDVQQTLVKLQDALMNVFN